MEWWEKIINDVSDNISRSADGSQAFGENIHIIRAAFWSLLDVYLQSGVEPDEVVALGLDYAENKATHSSNLYTLWVAVWAEDNGVDLVE